MDEKIKKIEQAMNDYIVGTKIEYTQLYDNLELFYCLSSILSANLSNHFEVLNEPIDFSKITRLSLVDKLTLIESFYKDHGIEFNLNEHIDDGTIEFTCYDHLNNNNDSKMKKNYYFNKGQNYYIDSKKLVDICNNGFVTDVLISVHELSHLRDQPKTSRHEMSHLLTESLAYAEELICADYLKELGYQDDVVLLTKEIFSSFYKISRSAGAEFKMFYLFKELGSISKDNYELLFSNNDEYENIIKYMYLISDKKNFNPYYYSWYIMGALLGTHMYCEYKKDPSFMKNISLLHDEINNFDIEKCFELMNLTDLGPKDMQQLENSLNLVISELTAKENNKSYQKSLILKNV